MNKSARLTAAFYILMVAVVPACTTAEPAAAEDFAVERGNVGQPGGALVVALRADPKTLNPVLSIDADSREVIGAMNADLIHVNRDTQRTEPALAKSWTVSPDGMRYVVQLRRGVKFSDGSAFTADDVVFSFQLYLDEGLHSPQRDLLILDGKPISVKKIDDYTVEFDLPKPYGAGDRLFDGLAIMPRHLLEAPFRQGKLAQLWGTNSPAGDIAGLGAFRLKEYLPGQRLVLERNPNYWKTDSNGRHLPYLSELTFVFVPNEDAQLVKFQGGEIQLLDRVSADNFEVLKREGSAERSMCDLGPGLEFIFLFFNQNELDDAKFRELSSKQTWFRNLSFRQAVSLAMDRESMARLVYGGMAAPIWGNVTPGNKLWMNVNVPTPKRSLEQARTLLRSADFSWDPKGRLLDAQKHPVSFTILVSSSNQQRSKLATIAQDDLAQLGMDVQVIPVEFRALVDRILNKRDYEAAIMNLVGGDVDPTTGMNLWLSGGETHLWHLGETKPATPWETEVDQLMQAQMESTDYLIRKREYDRVQQILSENLPFVFLLSPNILVGARTTVGNFHPVVLEPHAVWNADQLYLGKPGEAKCQ